MSAEFDLEQHLLDRIASEIPAFNKRLQAGQATALELRGQWLLVSQAMDLISSGTAAELALMQGELAAYGLGLNELIDELV